jgi:hypothetical protein
MSRAADLQIENAAATAAQSKHTQSTVKRTAANTPSVPAFRRRSIDPDAGCQLPSPRSHRIVDVCRLTGLGRTAIYSAIKAGDLIARKYGRSTVVLDDDVNDFLHNLPRRTAPVLNSNENAGDHIGSGSDTAHRGGRDE